MKRRLEAGVPRVAERSFGERRLRGNPRSVSGMKQARTVVGEESRRGGEKPRGRKEPKDGIFGARRSEKDRRESGHPLLGALKGKEPGRGGIRDRR